MLKLTTYVFTNKTKDGKRSFPSYAVYQDGKKVCNLKFAKACNLVPTSNCIIFAKNDDVFLSKKHVYTTYVVKHVERIEEIEKKATSTPFIEVED